MASVYRQTSSLRMGKYPHFVAVLIDNKGKFPHICFMMIYREQKLLRLAVVFSEHSEKPLSAVSRSFLGDSKTLPKLKSGSVISPSRYESAVASFDMSWPSDLDWPSDIPRPSVVEEDKAPAA